MNKINELMEIGNALLWKSQFEKAIDYFSKVINMQEDNAGAYESRGVSYMNLMAYEKALADLNKAIEFEPENHNAYFTRGMVYHYKKDLIQAKDNYEMAYKIYGDSVAYLSNLGNIHLLLKNYQESEFYCKRLLDINIDDTFAIETLAYVFMGSNQFESAIKYFSLALKKSPKNVDLYHNIGYSLLKLGKYQEAIKYFDTAIHYLDNYAYAYNNRGFCYFKLGHVEQGLKDIEYSLKKDPSNSYAYKNKALVFIHLNEKEKALRFLEKAKELGFSADYGSEVDDILKKEFGI